MNVTRCVTVFAIAACSLGLPPSYADEDRQAQAVGYRCHAVSIGLPEPGEIPATILVCQIVDAPDPVGTDALGSPPVGDATPAVDSLLQLLTTLRNTLQLAQAPQPGQTNAPKPTP